MPLRLQRRNHSLIVTGTPYSWFGHWLPSANSLKSHSEFPSCFLWVLFGVGVFFPSVESGVQSHGFWITAEPMVIVVITTRVTVKGQRRRARSARSAYDWCYQEACKVIAGPQQRPKDLLQGHPDAHMDRKGSAELEATWSFAVALTVWHL